MIISNNFIEAASDLRIRLLPSMNPHVLNKRGLWLDSAPTHITLILSLWVVHCLMLPWHLTITKWLVTDLTPVPVRKVNQVSVLHHMYPPNKNHGALSALNVHWLLLMCMDDMLLEVGLVPKSLPTQLTHGFLWGRFSSYFSFMFFLVTVGNEIKLLVCYSDKTS